jgi:dTMP kinase
MALMYSAARAQLVERVITPALQGGGVVVVDRYADSTIAYQAFGLGLELAVARDLSRIATGGLKPDVTFFIDVPPELGLRRLTARGRRDRLDAQTIGFHRRVYQGYQRLIDQEPARWVRVDGTLPPGLVHDAILGTVLSRVKALKEPA